MINSLITLITKTLGHFGPPLQTDGGSYKFGVVIVRWLVNEWVSESASELTDFLENGSNKFDNLFHEDKESQ